MKKHLVRAVERNVEGWLGAGAELVWQRFTDGVTKWVRAGHRDDLEGWRAALGPIFRLVLVGAAAYGAWLVVRRVPWLLWALLLTFLGAAWRAARTMPGEAVEDTPDEPRVEDRQEAAEKAFVEYVVASIGEARGVHLSTLAEGLRASGHLPGWEVPDVRAQCEALGIPCRRSVKVRTPAGKWAVAWGVHRDDVAALTTPSPDEADEAAA